MAAVVLNLQVDYTQCEKMQRYRTLWLQEFDDPSKSKPSSCIEAFLLAQNSCTAIQVCLKLFKKVDHKVKATKLYSVLTEL